MEKVECTVHLILSELAEIPPEPVGVEVGIQTKRNEIIPGHQNAEGWIFETDIQIMRAVDRIDFKGPTVHGPPGARFLYLSWKRQQDTPPLWVQRVKIPLSGAAELLEKAKMSENPILVVDITGRAPHDVTPLCWSLTG